jgi:hypothetical protein
MAEWRTGVLEQKAYARGVDVREGRRSQEEEFEAGATADYIGDRRRMEESCMGFSGGSLSQSPRRRQGGRLPGLGLIGDS